MNRHVPSSALTLGYMLAASSSVTGTGVRTMGASARPPKKADIAHP
jgi:hypothetical protein